MYLPTAPRNEQKYLFIDSGKNKLYAASLLSTLTLLIGMALFVKNNVWLLPYTAFCTITMIYLFFNYIVGFLSRDFNLKEHEFLVAKWLDRSITEEIDIYLPVCGESLDILNNTWSYVKALKEAHEGKIKIHVLDDSRDIKVASLADRFQFNYIIRPNNELKKAGNLRWAFARTTAPYFLILDADFCPRTDIIINLMPYFYEDPKIGISQSPQFFEVTIDQTLIQKGAGAVQELFYRLIQVNRDSFNGAICVGSNAIYSRRHLEPYGGTAAIGYSEDVRTGYRLSKDGGLVKYIPINLASGTCPETWKQYFTQLYRWSMGSLDLMLAKEFWQKGITKMQRVCYLTGMLYYTVTGLSVVFAYFPSIYLLLYKPDFIHWYNLLFSIPSLLLTVFFMKYWQKLPYDISALRVRHIASYAHLFALKDLIFNSMEEWTPTGTNNSSRRFESFKIFYMIHSTLVPLTVFFLIIARCLEGRPPQNFALLGVLTIFNLYIAIPVIRNLDQ